VHAGDPVAAKLRRLHELHFVQQHHRGSVGHRRRPQHRHGRQRRGRQAPAIMSGHPADAVPGVETGFEEVSRQALCLSPGGLLQQRRTLPVNIGPQRTVSCPRVIARLSDVCGSGRSAVAIRFLRAGSSRDSRQGTGAAEGREHACRRCSAGRGPGHAIAAATIQLPLEHGNRRKYVG
jgi:hypothetical protein